MVNLIDRTIGTTLLAVALSALLGCSQSGNPMGTVSGSIGYNGSPLDAGTVNLISKTGSAAMGKVTPGGKFAIEGKLEVGEYTVYVSPPKPEPHPPGKKLEVAKTLDLPRKFQGPATSDKIVVVRGGSNELAIELKD